MNGARATSRQIHLTNSVCLQPTCAQFGQFRWSHSGLWTMVARLLASRQAYSPQCRVQHLSALVSQFRTDTRLSYEACNLQSDKLPGLQTLTSCCKKKLHFFALWSFPLAEPTPTAVRVRMPTALAATPIKPWFAPYRGVGEAIGASPNENVRAGFLPRGH